MAWGRARRDAQRDMRNEGIKSSACKHKGPWNSAGPIKDNSGRSYTEYTCPDCGTEMRRHYYD